MSLTTAVTSSDHSYSSGKVARHKVLVGPCDRLTMEIMASYKNGPELAERVATAWKALEGAACDATKSAPTEHVMHGDASSMGDSEEKQHSLASMLHDPVVIRWEIPERFAPALNALRVSTGPEETTPEEEGRRALMAEVEDDLRRAHTTSFVDKLLGCAFYSRDCGEYNPDKKENAMESHLHALASVLGVYSVVRTAVTVSTDNSVSVGIVIQRPAGHHSPGSPLKPGESRNPDNIGKYCGANSVMVAAVKLATEFDATVGVFDPDVHFAGGSHYIRLQNQDLRIHHVDVSAAFYEPHVADEFLRVEGDGLIFPCITESHEHVLASSGYDPAKVLDDEKLIRCTRDAIKFFKDKKVSIILVSLGLDAGIGEVRYAEVTPAGFAAMTTLLTEVGIPLLFVLEGGYNIEPRGFFQANMKAVVSAVMGNYHFDEEEYKAKVAALPYSDLELGDMSAAMFFSRNFHFLLRAGIPVGKPMEEGLTEEEIRQMLSSHLDKISGAEGAYFRKVLELGRATGVS